MDRGEFVSQELVTTQEVVQVSASVGRATRRFACCTSTVFLYWLKVLAILGVGHIYLAMFCIKCAGTGLARGCHTVKGINPIFNRLKNIEWLGNAKEKPPPF